MFGTRLTQTCVVLHEVVPMSHGPHLNDIFLYNITKKRSKKKFKSFLFPLSKFLLNRRRVLVFASSGKLESPTAKGLLLGVRLLKKNSFEVKESLLWCKIFLSPCLLQMCRKWLTRSLLVLSVTSCHRILTHGNVKTVRREQLVVWMPFDSIVYANSFTSLKSRFLVIKMNAVNYKPN